MLQKEQIDDYLRKAQDTIEKAHKELLDVKLIQVNDPTEYPFIMNQLMEFDQEINDLLASASPEQRVQLEKAQGLLRETKTIMVRGI
jgi:ribosomal protein S12 methylthiotransferase accessory factor YcaO